MNKSAVVATDSDEAQMVFILNEINTFFLDGFSEELRHMGYTDVVPFRLVAEPEYAEDGSFTLFVSGTEASITPLVTDFAGCNAWEPILSGNYQDDITEDPQS